MFGLKTVLTTIVLIVHLIHQPILMAQEAPQRSITQITDGLYRAQNNNHNTVFLLTTDGIILADPINPEFSSWLKNELANRFDVPVKYVLYSHHHWDHGSGGAVFADTARFVAQENMQSYLTMPSSSSALTDVIGQYSPVAALDKDENGYIDNKEAEGNLNQRLFNAFDADKNSRLSGAEVLRGPLSFVHPPEITYKDRIEITLGGKTVLMEWVGEMNHSFDMSMISFPDEKALFLVDFVTIQRLPFREMDFELGMYKQWMAAIKAAEIKARSYETVITGHGPVGSWEDVSNWRRYFEDLEKVVAEAIASGQTLEQMRSSIKLEEYSDWAGYQWLHENVLGMYHFLTDQ